jgi:hypothetical protein
VIARNVSKVQGPVLPGPAIVDLKWFLTDSTPFSCRHVTVVSSIEKFVGSS